MSIPVKNVDDLRAEIIRLQRLRIEQTAAIGERFSTFSSTVSTIYSIFPKTPGVEGHSKGFFDQDLVGLVSRFILPFTLNKTIFRNSNFIIKSIVGLVSQKASHFISEDSVVSVWDKVKSIFTKKHKEETALVRVKEPAIVIPRKEGI